MLQITQFQVWRHLASIRFESSNIDPIRLPSQKLPFTIPELVQASPCRSSDGVLYMGKARFQIPDSSVELRCS